MTEAAPASVTGRRIGKSLRVSAFPRPQLRLVPARVAAGGADSIPPPDLPEEAVRRALAEDGSNSEGEHDDRRKFVAPMQHSGSTLGAPCGTSIPRSGERKNFPLSS